jgi:hypothetical protein
MFQGQPLTLTLAPIGAREQTPDSASPLHGRGRRRRVRGCSSAHCWSEVCAGGRRSCSAERRVCDGAGLRPAWAITARADVRWSVPLCKPRTVASSGAWYIAERGWPRHLTPARLMPARTNSCVTRTRPRSMVAAIRAVGAARSTLADTAVIGVLSVRFAMGLDASRLAGSTWDAREAFALRGGRHKERWLDGLGGMHRFRALCSNNHAVITIDDRILALIHSRSWWTQDLARTLSWPIASGRTTQPARLIERIFELVFEGSHPVSDWQSVCGEWCSRGRRRAAAKA